MKPTLMLTIHVIFVGLLFIKTVQMIATVKWTNVICQSRNTTWVTFDKCRLRAISRNKTVLNIDINVHFPARSITLYWQMQKRENGYKPWLGRYTIDYCAFLRKTNHPVMKIFWDVIKDFINFNHPCPIDGLLIIKDLFWDARNFSLPFPSGDYMLHLTWLLISGSSISKRFTLLSIRTYLKNNHGFQLTK